jgi:hypothetical protein
VSSVPTERHPVGVSKIELQLGKQEGDLHPDRRVRAAA